MALYINDIGPDRFATLAAVRRAYGLSIGEASALLADLPARLPDIDMAAEVVVIASLSDLGASVGREPAAKKSEETTTGNSVPHSIEISVEPVSDPEPVYEPDPEPVHVFKPVDVPQHKREPEPVYEPAAEPVSKPAPEEGPVNVMLTDCGPSKLAVVKAVMDGTEMRLAASKNLVDSAPVLIKVKNKDRARWLLTRLTELGATAFLPDEDKGTPSNSEGARAITSITVTNAGRSGMQLVRLLKERLGMKYAEAANIVEKGGRLPVTYDTTYQSQTEADRMVRDLTALGVAFTTA